MTSCHVLALPNLSKPFTIEADACGTGLGVVLMQDSRPIAYYSKAISPNSLGKSIYEKEAMAILEALKKWRHYLLGNPLIIKTDQQALKFMTTQRLTDGIQHKLLLKLLEFDYSIEYKKGNKNIVADALSRKDQTSSTTCNQVTVIQAEWLQDIRNSYMQDPDSSKLLSKLAQDVQENSNFSLTDGILKFKNRLYIGAATDFRQTLLHTFHNSAIGGHSGIRATLHRLKKHFYWPNMKKDVEQYISVCPVCQLTKVEHVHSPGLLDPLEVPAVPWSHISMDFIEALPKSQGKDVILVVVDRSAEYAHFLPLSHPYSVESVLKLFLDNIVKLHGMPIVIVSDRDRIY